MKKKFSLKKTKRILENLISGESINMTELSMKSYTSYNECYNHAYIMKDVFEWITIEENETGKIIRRNVRITDDGKNFYSKLVNLF